MKALRTMLFWMCLCGVSSSGYAQGIPVVDETAILKMIDQAVQMEKDYMEFTRQTQALTDKLSTLKNINAESVMRAASDVGGEVFEAVAQGFTQGSTFEQQWAAARKALEAAGTQHRQQQQQMATEAARLSDLINQSQSAGGTLAAQQAGNQISAEVVQQLQFLRSQLLMQSQNQNAELNVRQKEREAERRVSKFFFGG